MSYPCPISCPICGNVTIFLDKVNFNKCCNGYGFPKCDLDVEYNMCPVCSFTFSPDLYQWTPETFKNFIYNEDYIKVDPDHQELRPKENAIWLNQSLSAHKNYIRHLDYGGGEGIMSNVLTSLNWSSTSYDPFYQKNEIRGSYDLITAFEVIEHLPNVVEVISYLENILSNNGMILFSTLLSDRKLKLPLDWWYISPRNGHISIFSKTSLTILAEKFGLTFESLSPLIHGFYKNRPEWVRFIK